MLNNLNVILLCAGKSSRMGLNLPKVTLAINGTSIVERTLTNIQKLNPKRIIVVVGYKKKLVINKVKQLDYQNIEIVEQKKQLGTGDAIKPALIKLNKNSQVLIMNGDTPFVTPKTLKKALKSFKSNSSDFLITISKLSNPFGYGRIVKDSYKNITKIVEEKNCTPDQRKINEVNSGLYICKSELLKNFIKKIKKNTNNEYYLTDLVEIFSKNNKKITSIIEKDENAFFNINSFEDLIKANQIDNNYFLENCLRKNINIHDPNSLRISTNVKLSSNISIGPNVYIDGNSVIEEGVNIVGNCYINNSVIGSKTLIKPFVSISDSKVGKNCQLGPFSNIRPQTELANNIKIGNFVELKKSIISDNSKIPHLSYIGDTEMGSNVNIGAGTITCNYDGFDKHKTVIEDRVFIGSDTMLVAPIKIEKGATTGAGSVISRNLPKNTLGITRIKEKMIPNWKRKPKVKK